MSEPIHPVAPEMQAPYNGQAVPHAQQTPSPAVPPQGQPQVIPPQATITPVGTHHQYAGQPAQAQAGLPARLPNGQPAPQKTNFFETHQKTILVGVGAGLLGMMFGGGKVTIPGTTRRGPQSS